MVYEVLGLRPSMCGRSLTFREASNFISGLRPSMCGRSLTFREAANFISGLLPSMCGRSLTFHEASNFISGLRPSMCGRSLTFREAANFISGLRPTAEMATEKFQISRDSQALYITAVTKDRRRSFGLTQSRILFARQLMKHEILVGSYCLLM
jgi:hypothetical protein